MRWLRCGDEEPRGVELRVSGGRLQVVVDGVVHEPDVAAVGPGAFVLRAGSARELFHCVRDGDAIHLFWRGDVYRIEDLGEGRRAAARHAAGALEAPMPGKVIEISVAVGDPVAKGQQLLVVEAMKMENALRAPRDGTVRSIATSVGEMVAPGRALVQID